ncbi:hypothetical protein KP004_14270 [Geomonas oryzisoli]|uniref:DUF4760 domain-containing protein n=1 Tax=Geomonas oryzisoli TaxID=2847992 RepID=A0ABX8J5G4_9BACT|nr:hypothetical protein [Geomonas oryzisoli]QWV92366.1 hypothetical protein KP004_14270 [Geomonas oryzisoli]
MHTYYVIQIATLASCIAGIASIIFGIFIYKRQSNIQVFIAYTKRYEEVMQFFPHEAISARLDSDCSLPPESQELTLAVLKYLNLCSEEFYLWKSRYLCSKIWAIWEDELKRTLSSPLYCREWPKVKNEFESYPAFLEFIQKVQRECPLVAKLGSSMQSGNP